jgi:outer membrane murein-binding lipoprotein Lpp
MPSTARAAWIDAWEGASTPSSYSYRSVTSRRRDERYAPYKAQTRPVRCAERQPARLSQWRDDWQDASEWTGSVVRISSGGKAPRQTVDRYQSRTDMHEVSAIDGYDWDAAARRRPGRNECERVILHADRSIEARMDSTHYYATGATARRPEVWPDAPRRATAPRLKVVKHRVPRWRLGMVAGVFALLLIGLTIVAPIVASSAVAGLESAVGQAEAQQQQLAADTAALSSQVSSLSSPQRVANEAAQLGLVPANDVSYLPSGEQMLASEGDTTVAGR